MPDVVGRTREEAERLLRGAGPRAGGDRARGRGRRAGHGARAGSRRPGRSSRRAARSSSSSPKAPAEVDGARRDRRDRGRRGRGARGRGLRGHASRTRPPRRPTRTGSCSTRTRRRTARAPNGSEVTISVGRFEPRADPEPDADAGAARRRREGRRAARRPLVRARGLARVRGVGLRRASRRPATRCCRCCSSATARWRGPDGDAARLDARRRPARRRRRLPGPARPVRRGRHGPGAARAARRAVRRRGRARLLAVHGQDRLQGRARGGRRAAGRLRGGARGALARAPEAVRAELAPLGLPLFVKPARLGSSVGIAKVRDADGARRARSTARSRTTGS